MPKNDRKSKKLWDRRLLPVRKCKRRRGGGGLMAGCYLLIGSAVARPSQPARKEPDLRCDRRSPGACCQADHFRTWEHVPRRRRHRAEEQERCGRGQQYRAQQYRAQQYRGQQYRGPFRRRQRSRWARSESRAGEAAMSSDRRRRPTFDGRGRTRVATGTLQGDAYARGLRGPT